MTIMEAMEKAKRLGKERKAAEVAEGVRTHLPKVAHAELAIPRIRPPELA